MLTLLLRVATLIVVTVSSTWCLRNVAYASDLNNIFVPSGNDKIRTGDVIDLSWPDLPINRDSLSVVLWNGKAGSEEVLAHVGGPTFNYRWVVMAQPGNLYRIRLLSKRTGVLLKQSSSYFSILPTEIPVRQEEMNGSAGWTQVGHDEVRLTMIDLLTNNAEVELVVASDYLGRVLLHANSTVGFSDELKRVTSAADCMRNRPVFIRVLYKNGSSRTTVTMSD